MPRPGRSGTSAHPGEAELHGFAWLDDLAALGDSRARARAQDWLFGWIDRYGTGRGPGWTPDLTGRRVVRWINHAHLILHGRSPDDNERFFRSLGGQVLYLSRRWQSRRPACRGSRRWRV